MRIFDKESIDKIDNKIINGKKLSRTENVSYCGMINTRKSNIKYSYNIIELKEYANCCNDIYYFAEKYCGVLLRDYQEKILNEYKDNRFVINFTSRQMGTTIIHAIYFLHKMLFNDKFNIGIVSNKTMSSKEVLEKLKYYYKQIPFFLKQGITKWENTRIIFENESRLDVISYYKGGLDISCDYDIITINDFSKMYKCEYLYKLIVPTIMSIENSQLIISSQPNGNNFFKTLVDRTHESHPDRNMFKLTKTYWWQIPGRDEKWRQNQINMIGSEKMFAQEYELCFIY